MTTKEYEYEYEQAELTASFIGDAHELLRQGRISMAVQSFDQGLLRCHPRVSPMDRQAIIIRTISYWLATQD